MSLLLLGLFLFLGVHSVRIVLPDIRERVITRGGGRGAWMWPYTGVAGVGFALIIVGYALARPEAPVLYFPPPGLRHLALVIMLPVFPLLLATYLKGRLGQSVRHPMLLATMLWASAHLLSNGSLADLALFGGFLAWSALYRHRLIRQEGSAAPVPWGRNDLIAVAGGLALYALFIGGLHAFLFGVSPL